MPRYVTVPSPIMSEVWGGAASGDLLMENGFPLLMEGSGVGADDRILLEIATRTTQGMVKPIHKLLHVEKIAESIMTSLPVWYNLLQESGSFLLQEDNTKILIEGETGSRAYIASVKDE